MSKPIPPSLIDKMNKMDKAIDECIKNGEMTFTADWIIKAKWRDVQNEINKLLLKQ